VTVWAETDAVVLHLGHYEAGVVQSALLAYREAGNYVPSRLLHRPFAGHGQVTVVFTPQED